MPEPEKKEMALDMRHSKLKAEEAAILLGELKKPSWQSRNEGIHERVSFEDSIWGFDLAGGSYYKTPLRVVMVKPDSRAEKAGIRPGDKLTRINDIDTSTLTIQEAHEIIIESGIHLKLAVTAPEDEEDSYFCYEDPLESGYDSEEERRKQKEKERKRIVHAKVSSYWSLQWPWVSKRRVIYRESNCFMVPSKYETNHSEKFSPVPFLRTESDVVLEGTAAAQSKSEAENLTKANMQTNGDIAQNGNQVLHNGNESGQDDYEADSEMESDSISNAKQSPTQNDNNKAPDKANGLQEEIDTNEDDSVLQNSIEEEISVPDDFVKQNGESNNTFYPSDMITSEEDDINKNGESNNTFSPSDMVTSEDDDINKLDEDESLSEMDEDSQKDVHENTSTPSVQIFTPEDDEIINEINDLNGNVSNNEEDEILNSILSESEDISTTNETVDEG